MTELVVGRYKLPKDMYIIDATGSSDSNTAFITDISNFSTFTNVYFFSKWCNFG